MPKIQLKKKQRSSLNFQQPVSIPESIPVSIPVSVTQDETFEEPDYLNEEQASSLTEDTTITASNTASITSADEIFSNPVELGINQETIF